MKSFPSGTGAHFSDQYVTESVRIFPSDFWKAELRALVLGVSSASHPSDRTTKSVDGRESSGSAENFSDTKAPMLVKSVQNEVEYLLDIHDRRVAKAVASVVLGMASAASPAKTVRECEFSGCPFTIRTMKVFALSRRLSSNPSSTASIDLETSKTNMTFFGSRTCVSTLTANFVEESARNARAIPKDARLIERRVRETR